MATTSIIQQRTFGFALTMVKFCRHLISEKEYIISKQLLRCATSIGANVEEATAAQTKKDFIVKMSIASKEAREARYWLRLIKESELTDIEIDGFLSDVEHIINILTKIVKTSQASLNT